MDVVAGTPSDVVWTRLDCGAEITAPLDDYVGRAAYFVGDLDRKVSRVIARILRPGDRVVDVGAQLGLVTLQAAGIVGAGGEIHAFEPNPRIRTLLQRSLERNGFTHVVVHDEALGRAAGSLDLLFPPGTNSGRATLDPDRAPSDAERISVRVARLDDALPAGPSVRLMKLDVEGFEAEVLLGATRLLADTPPATILFEDNGPGRSNPDFSPASILADHGYVLHAIPRTLVRLKLLRLADGHPAGERSHDILAIHESVYSEVAERLPIT